MTTPPFEDGSGDPDLDTGGWLPHHLPHRSSRADSAAAYGVSGSCLRLRLPEHSPLWCPDDHPPLRVSGIQSGVFAGPVGRPERCAELCVMEAFGDDVDPGHSAAVGMGTHPFRDPRGVEDFAAPRLEIDVAEFHTYAVDPRPDGAAFLVDGEPVRTVVVTPDHPVQSMPAVFDFPEKAAAGGPCTEPQLVVEHVRGPASAHPWG